MIDFSKFDFAVIGFAAGLQIIIGTLFVYALAKRLLRLQRTAEKVLCAICCVASAAAVSILCSRNVASAVVLLLVSAAEALLMRHLRRRQKYTVELLDEMSGREFELACAEILECNGFCNVEVTKSTGDFGVDILASRGEERYAVQCKCYAHKLDGTPVQEVAGGLRYYECDKGAVMTNSYFTKAAESLAQANDIELWDRDSLADMLRSVKL